jgi:hypothetical protein
MSKTPEFKEGSLDAFDFILSVIREHDKDLDKLTADLASIAKRKGARTELIKKFERIEAKVISLQKDVDKLGKILSFDP